MKIPSTPRLITNNGSNKPTPPEPPESPKEGFFDNFQTDTFKMALAGGIVGGASGLTGSLGGAKVGLLAGLAGGGVAGMAGVPSTSGVEGRFAGAVLGGGFAHAAGVIGSAMPPAVATACGTLIGVAVGIAIATGNNNDAAGKP